MGDGFMIFTESEIGHQLQQLELSIMTELKRRRPNWNRVIYLKLCQISRQIECATRRLNKKEDSLDGSTL